jgi:hypothetical protein
LYIAVCSRRKSKAIKRKTEEFNVNKSLKFQKKKARPPSSSDSDTVETEPQGPAPVNVR